MVELFVYLSMQAASGDEQKGAIIIPVLVENPEIWPYEHDELLDSWRSFRADELGEPNTVLFSKNCPAYFLK